MLLSIVLFATAVVAFMWIRVRHKRKNSGMSAH
jgi:hypothetical protein